jgi:hypothetical protein
MRVPVVVHWDTITAAVVMPSSTLSGTTIITRNHLRCCGTHRMIPLDAVDSLLRQRHLAGLLVARAGVEQYFAWGRWTNARRTKIATMCAKSPSTLCSPIPVTITDLMKSVRKSPYSAITAFRCMDERLSGRLTKYYQSLCNEESMRLDIALRAQELITLFDKIENRDILKQLTSKFQDEQDTALKLYKGSDFQLVALQELQHKEQEVLRVLWQQIRILTPANVLPDLRTMISSLRWLSYYNLNETNSVDFRLALTQSMQVQMTKRFNHPEEVLIRALSPEFLYSIAEQIPFDVPLQSLHVVAAVSCGRQTCCTGCEQDLLFVQWKLSEWAHQLCDNSGAVVAIECLSSAQSLSRSNTVSNIGISGVDIAQLDIHNQIAPFFLRRLVDTSEQNCRSQMTLQDDTPADLFPDHSVFIGGNHETIVAVESLLHDGGAS